MSLLIPSSPLEISTDWLSMALSGHNPDQTSGQVRVSTVDITVGTKWNEADTAFVNVSYHSGSRRLPPRLFIKLRTHPDPLASIFQGELAFYASAQNTGLPIAPCLASLSDPQTGATCIILEDLSSTHETSPWPLPPTLSRCLMAVRSLAEVHAHWTQRANPEHHHSQSSLNQLAVEMLPNFLAELGDRLSRDRAELLTQVCLKIPSLKTARYEAGRPVTRIHGDAHFWNVLYPKDPEKAQAILIDFEDWRVDFAGLDLALLLAMHWYPQRRAHHEVDMLKEYLRAYNACTASRLSWEELWLDYRLGHICNAVIPLFQHAAGGEHASWWSHLERWFLAFDDLLCKELL